MSIHRTKYGFLKKCFPKIKILACLVLMCILLFSCSQDNEPKNTGIKVDKEVFESIRQSIADKQDPILANDGDVFWTPSGTLWHLYYDCSYVVNSNTVLHGTLEEAKTAGKVKECERCSKNRSEIYPQTDEIKEGDVFWTRSGNLWHTEQDCRYISNSNEVLHGSVEEAKNAGKTGICSSCDK